MIVRRTHGLVGAQSLGRISGLPRRICAELKRRELRELEIARKHERTQSSIRLRLEKLGKIEPSPAQ